MCLWAGKAWQRSILWTFSLVQGKEVNKGALLFLGQVKDFGYLDYFVLSTGADKASNTLGWQPAQCEVVNCLAKESLELSDPAFPLLRHCFEEHSATNTWFLIKWTMPLRQLVILNSRLSIYDHWNCCLIKKKSDAAGQNFHIPTFWPSLNVYSWYSYLKLM